MSDHPSNLLPASTPRRKQPPMTMPSLRSFAAVAMTKPSNVPIEAIGAMLAATDDDAVLAFYARTNDEIETVVAPLRWAKELLENELGRRLRERRAERGGDARIEIPHPAIDVALEVEFSTYAVDVDLLEQAVLGLHPDEAAKLLKRVPAYTETIPARVAVYPEQLVPAPAITILAAAKRYAGSETGAALAACVTRKHTGDKIRIGLKKIAPARRSAK